MTSRGREERVGEAKATVPAMNKAQRTKVLTFVGPVGILSCSAHTKPRACTPNLGSMGREPCLSLHRENNSRRLGASRPVGISSASTLDPCYKGGDVCASELQLEENEDLAQGGWNAPPLGCASLPTPCRE